MYVFIFVVGNRVIEKKEFKAVLQILGIVNHNFWSLLNYVDNLLRCDNSHGLRVASDQDDTVIDDIIGLRMRKICQARVEVDFLPRIASFVHQLLKSLHNMYIYG